MDLSKCRIWETKFQVFKAIPSLPQPFVTVLEKQTSPRYHIENRASRSTSTAMLRVTLKGEGAFRCKGKVWPLPPGKAYLARDYDADTAYYYPGHAKEPWIFLWFGFQCVCIDSFVRELNARYGYVFDLPLDSGVVRYIESMRSLRGTVQALSPTAGAKIVMDVLSGLGDVIERPQLENPNVELVKSAQELIASQIEKGLKVADIARSLGISREHLSRVFKEQTGLSPLEFAGAERMRLAARIISGGRITCKELSERLGYDSASSFARAFKRYYGTSPGSRQKLKS